MVFLFDLWSLVVSIANGVCAGIHTKVVSYVSWSLFFFVEIPHCKQILQHKLVSGYRPERRDLLQPLLSFPHRCRKSGLLHVLRFRVFFQRPFPRGSRSFVSSSSSPSSAPSLVFVSASTFGSFPITPSNWDHRASTELNSLPTYFRIPSAF